MAQNELLQIVDMHTGEPTGEHIARSEFHKNKLWGRSTNIFVLNTEGQILCHHRPMDKEYFPGAWSTHFGGHIVEGESYKIGALKEIEEEIGIKINAHQLVPWRTSKKSIARLWVRDFITVLDRDISTIKFQESEITEIKWFTPQEILEYLDAEDVETGLNVGSWMAGTHNFNEDYQCMRAVLTAMLDIGIFGGDYKPLHKWHPPKHANVT
ncbi:MAG: hydrolase [Candidatus Nomurabacteria bacterium]|nr:hydrolase [Candidatus Nomurabacteria bacterium]